MGGPNINTRVLIRARGEAGNSERDVIIEAKVSHMTMGQRTHEVSRSWKHQGTTLLEPPKRNTALLPP